MIRNLKHIIIFIICFWAFSLSAQDPHFSQNQNTNSYLNPALSGVYEGSMQFGVNYRDQWSSVLGTQKFITGNVNGDLKFKIFGDDYVSVNVNAMFDQAGRSFYNQALLHLGGSYIKKLSENYNGGQYLSVGFRAGMGQNSLDWGRLWFDRQFDRNSESVNTDINNGEPGIGGGRGKTDFYPDMGVGVFWYMITGDNSSVFAGLSANHLNTPDISLLQSSSTRGQLLYTKWSGQVGAELSLNNTLSVIPNLMLWVQGPSWQSVIGSAIQYDGYADDDLSMRLGIMARLANSSESSVIFDSFILDVGFEFSKYEIGLSYDISVSQLSLASKNRGAFEISLIYRKPYETSYRKQSNFPRL